MALKETIEEIVVDVTDVIGTSFVYADTYTVPSLIDVQLTYESGVAKRGKRISTCVLFVDIRNSVALTERHQTITMGRIYTAFTKAVLKIAAQHDGHIRNIIGDRVMIVFPSANCFTNAVDCAISINYIVKNIINKKFRDVDFKCGIGIDYGELRVIKVGIQRRGSEHAENKGLVWVGYPANIASRLTDKANKLFEEPYFEVVRNPLNPSAIRPLIDLSIFGMRSNYDPKAPIYLKTVETVEMTTEEFANNISSISEGRLFMLGGNFISFSKKTKSFSYSPILMTEVVYKGFKRHNPRRASILENLWTEQKHTIQNVSGKIFGGDVTWNFK